MRENYFLKQKNWKPLFFIFTNLFDIGLIEERFSYLFLPSVCCEMRLQCKCIKKMKLHTDRSWKKEEYFNSLSDNRGNFYLIQLQNSKSSHSFKISYSVESEFISVSFFYTVRLKSLICLALWMGLLHRHDFITSCIGHGKHWCNELCRFF